MLSPVLVSWHFPLLTLFGLAAFGTFAAEPLRVAPHRAEGHIIVRFHPDRVKGVGLPGVEAETRLELLGLPRRARLRENELSRWRREVERVRGKTSAEDNSHRYFLLDLPEELSPEEAVQLARQSAWVEYAEVDPIATAATTIPNDPDFGLQWHHQNLIVTNREVSPDIRTIEAWDMTRGSSNVVVAVLDTGCNVSLGEFAGRILPGYDFVNRDADPSDDNGHGTLVAGVLGASGNNGQLVAGVDWHCKILPVKVLASDKSGLFSTLADGIDWAVEQGARVITLSAGGFDSNITLSNAVTRAISSGVVFVAASHNDGGVIRFPARLPGVIAVGATTITDRRASFSNFGPELSLVAPGTNIYSVNRSGRTQREWGTSLAAPQVAGAASLLLAVRPELRPAEIQELLCAGADDLVGAVTEDIPGFDRFHGYGRLNVEAALRLAATRIETSKQGNQLTLSWSAPANAVAKQPFEVEFAPSPNGPWQRVASPVSFEGGAASWSTDVLAATAESSQGYYRVRVQK